MGEDFINLQRILPSYGPITTCLLDLLPPVVQCAWQYLGVESILDLELEYLDDV